MRRFCVMDIRLLFMCMAAAASAAAGCARDSWWIPAGRDVKGARAVAENGSNESHEGMWSPLWPRDGVRAELLNLDVPGEAIAHFLPEVEQSSVQLVSGVPAANGARITHLDGHKVHNWADVLSALENAGDERKPLQVDLEFANEGRASHQAVRLPKTKVATLLHTTHDGPAAVRYTHDAVPWLLFRENGTWCRLAMRVDQQRRLVHLVVESKNSWAPACLLPVDIRISSGGQLLQCLSAADVLDVLYGEGQPKQTEGGPRLSFAAVADRDDYVTPTNYPRLAKEAEEDDSKSFSRTPLLAAAPGAIYPGPAILGDARALAGLLLQRQTHPPGGPETLGWVFFFSEQPLANDVEVVVDLGRGPRTLRFALPAD